MADAPRFLLYAYWRTSAAYRVRVGLALKGLAWEERFVDIDKGENRAAAYLRINPLGGVPAFLDRGSGTPEGVLTQSLAILDYLEEVAPSPPLLPPDAFGRARVRSLGAMVAADSHPLITPRVRKYLTGPGGFDDAAWRAWQVHWFTTGLQAIETRLAAEPETGSFCHSEQVTIADICLASLVAVMRVFKIEVPDIPTIDAIMAAARPWSPSHGPRRTGRRVRRRADTDRLERPKPRRAHPPAPRDQGSRFAIRAPTARPAAMAR